MRQRGCAGTMESSDIYVEVAQLPAGSGVQIALNSVVYAQFGAAIEAVIRETLAALSITDVEVTANDRGAVDCTIQARVETAVQRMKGDGQ